VRWYDCRCAAVGALPSCGLQDRKVLTANTSIRSSPAILRVSFFRKESIIKAVLKSKKHVLSCRA
jgi:hypothetical protein